MGKPNRPFSKISLFSLKEFASKWFAISLGTYNCARECLCKILEGKQRVLWSFVKDFSFKVMFYPVPGSRSL